jgi:hypothetical protein
MQAVKKIVRKIVPRPVQTPPAPVEVEESAYSVIWSTYDEPGRPTQRLVELAIDAVERAMKDVQVRGSVWPGEELCLLGGLMLAMRPKVVVQIGRGDARAAEVLKQYLGDGKYFRLDEVGDEVAAAEFILVSGPADGKFEEKVLEDLGRVNFARPPIVMFNDTRRWEMLRFVREIRYPKLDMTSFGRWAGTMMLELTRL